MTNKLSEISYYKTGGTCDMLCEPSSLIELTQAMTAISTRKCPYFLLGAGSNSLVMDDHWHGAVVSFHKMNQYSFPTPTALEVMAGVENSKIAELCLAKNLAGAAWMHQLPGQIGATVRMNARAYDGEISQLVDHVTAVTPTGEIKTYQRDDIFLGYKDTIFQRNNDIVALVRLNLTMGNNSEILDKMNLCARDRKTRHQFLHPSCGCVFKNNYEAGVSSGKLLDQTGARELKSDHAKISPFHANFVFNLGAASSREILELTFIMREAVYLEFGVWLEYEMQILGHLPDDLAARVNEVKPQNFNQQKLAPLRAAFNPQKCK